jgi:chromosome segregation ATPase
LPTETTFDPKDFTALQNAMSQLAVLAGAAPVFIASIAAAQRIMSAQAEAGDAVARAQATLAEVTGQIDYAQKALDGLSQRQTAATAKVAEVEQLAAEAKTDYDAAKAALDASLATYARQANDRVGAEIAAAEGAAKVRIESLNAEVDVLESRRDAAEAAIKAIKAGL